MGSKRKRQKFELENELVDCAWHDDLDRLQELIQIERVEVDCRSGGTGYTALTCALLHGNDKVAQFLLENGADVDAEVDQDGETVLSKVIVECRNVELAEFLLEHGANPETKCYPYVEHGAYSALATAIDTRNIEMVRLLLRYGANTKKTLCRGKLFTALYVACHYNEAEHEYDDDEFEEDDIDSEEDIVQLLIDHDDGATVNSFLRRPRGRLGRRPAPKSPLCAACRRDSLEIAQLLIQNGARVIYDGKYPNSPCPLKHAVSHGSLQLVQFLLDSSGFSATGGNAILSRDDSAGKAHPLTLPLKTAIEKSNLGAAQLLVERGANVNDKPFLLECAQHGRREMTHFLLRAGANVNQADDEGETPLWAAAGQGNVELVRELLKAGADASISDCDGETPLGVAYRRGHKGAVYLLLRTSPSAWSRLKDAW